MKLTSISLKNIRSFKVIPKTNLSEKINVFVGHNNSGKSTILKSILLLQDPNALDCKDKRFGTPNGMVEYDFYDPYNVGGLLPNGSMGKIGFYFNNAAGQPKRAYQRGGSSQKFSLKTFPSVEPNNLLYPFLSRRKVGSYIDVINGINANSVTGDFTNLYSKIDRLINPYVEPAHSEYIKACKDVLGFQVTTLPIGNGKSAVYIINNLEYIPLTSMGEGVPNLLALIADLCLAENKIFLIEEPENDIHPKALKKLLKLIEAKSFTNQFFISTHSNIVMKYLGASESSKIFHIDGQIKPDNNGRKLFYSSISEIPREENARKNVLEELGYEFHDYGLWKAWLFLEESSAEVLIRDWFIKWYTPDLVGKLATFSARSLSEIEPKFDDFNRLFVFQHLEPLYKNKAWVIVDAGEKKEKEVIDRFHNTYCKNGWSEENFSQFSEHDFERYYPKEFQEEVHRVLEIEEKKAKRKAKKELIENVKKWIQEDPDRAKSEFEKSAAPVIEKLRAIEKSLLES